MRCAAVLLMTLSVPLTAQVAVVGPLVHELTLNTERMAEILQGRVTTWADGRAVVLVLVDDQDADEHLQRIAGRPRERLLRAWKRLVFSGAGVMPLEAPNVTAALELVARTPGAVALLASAVADPRWRVLPVATSAQP